MKLSIASDYIAPSSSCIVSLDGKRLDLSKDDGASQSEAGEVLLHNRGQPEPPKGPVKVTLHDCLACSGCLTSAETVMLEHQSVDELLSRLKDPSSRVIVSISPQSRSSLAAYYGLSPTETFAKLTTLFTDLGAVQVLDTTCARDFSLVESAQEFVERFRRSQEASTAPEAILTSACPGWVVYAEKTHGDEVIPFLSRVKSPQGVMGSLVKRFLCQRLGIDPAKTYHCAVMPCYDRKLEAARDELRTPSAAPAPETDAVLATAEVQMLIERLALDFRALPAAPIPSDSLVSLDPTTGRLCGYPGSAGGYLEYVFRTAVRELFGETVPPGPLPRVPGRNGDSWEVHWVRDGKVALRFAAAYGFRNVKATVRKLQLQQKRAGGGEAPLHYVEIMACPSGCLNGGGQVLPPGVPAGPGALDALDRAHHSPEGILMRSPEESPVLRQFYAEVAEGRPGSEAARELLHTAFKSRKADAAIAAALQW